MAKAVQLKDKAGNKIYAAPYFPIGSIYLSINKTNPSTYFGGTWEQLYGGYLYAAQSAIGKTDYVGWNTQSGGGGTSGSTALQTKHLPSHSHPVYQNNGSNYSIPVYGLYSVHDNTGYINFRYSNEGTFTTGSGGVGMLSTGSVGSGTGHTHSTPNHSHNIATVDVFVWKRVA